MPLGFKFLLFGLSWVPEVPGGPGKAKGGLSGPSRGPPEPPSGAPGAPGARVKKIEKLYLLRGTFLRPSVSILVGLGVSTRSHESRHKIPRGSTSDRSVFKDAFYLVQVSPPSWGVGEGPDCHFHEEIGSLGAIPARIRGVPDFRFEFLMVEPKCHEIASWAVSRCVLYPCSSRTHLEGSWVPFWLIIIIILA